ncbi:MAG: ribosome small subunit-dependent GTPase A [Casimicrobiaceae bacterium]
MPGPRDPARARLAGAPPRVTGATGLVTAAHRRHYAVRQDDGSTVSCVLLGRSLAIACGDRVRWSASGPGEGVIESIEPRTSLLYRSDTRREKLIAANVTQVLGMVAPEPPFDDELVHRWMVAAESTGCRFILIANKRDLPSFATVRPRLAQFAALGYAVTEICASEDARVLLPLLAGHHSVLIGQSGMGKSTLINRLLPGASARVREVSSALHTGRHTTTETILYPLDGSGWIVDSPGMKEFGLGHLAANALERGFVELRPLLGSCRFRDCRHDSEPGCAIRDAIDRGDVKPWRVALLRQLLIDSGRRTRTW